MRIIYLCACEGGRGTTVFRNTVARARGQETVGQLLGADYCGATDIAASLALTKRVLSGIQSMLQPRQKLSAVACRPFWVIVVNAINPRGHFFWPHPCIGCVFVFRLDIGVWLRMLHRSDDRATG